MPRQRVVAARAHPVADHRDRALGGVVDVDEPAPLRLGPEGRLDPHAHGGELVVGAMAEPVVAQRGVESGAARELGQLHRRHGAAAARLLPRLFGVHDLAGHRHALHARELDPLHVPHHGDPHDRDTLRPTPVLAVQGIDMPGRNVPRR